jgi:hypothetical protein
VTTFHLSYQPSTIHPSAHCRIPHPFPSNYYQLKSAIGTMSDNTTTASLPVRVLTKAEVNALSAEEKAAYREDQQCLCEIKASKKKCSNISGGS